MPAEPEMASMRTAAGQILLGHPAQQFLAFFQDVAVVALVGGIYDIVGVVQHDAFNGSGTDVQTNSHSETSRSWGKGRAPADPPAFVRRAISLF